MKFKKTNCGGFACTGQAHCKSLPLCMRTSLTLVLVVAAFGAGLLCDRLLQDRLLQPLCERTLCSRAVQRARLMRVAPRTGQWRVPTAEEVAAYEKDASFRHHAQWEVRPGLVLAGPSDTPLLLARVLDRLRPSLRGQTVLDIGTVNGGAAFEMERRGATVFALDIFEPTRYGFEQMHRLLNSQVTFLRMSLLYLPDVFEPESFDVINFAGVLYHLRHPLVAIDAISVVLKKGGLLVVETAAINEPVPNPLDAQRTFLGYCPGKSCSNDATNMFFFSNSSLVALFADNGFRLLSVTPRPSPANVERLYATFEKTGDHAYGYELEGGGDFMKSDVIFPHLPCSG